MNDPKHIRTLVEQAKDTNERIQFLYALAAAYLEQEESEKALESMQEARELIPQLPEKEKNEATLMWATLLHNVGIVFQEEGAFQNAIRAFSNSAETYRQLFETEGKDHLEPLINARLALAETLQAEKDFYRSRKNYKTILELLPKFSTDQDSEKIKSTQAYCYMQMGSIALEELNTEEARELLSKALFRFQELANEKSSEYRPQLAFSLNNLGIACKLNNQYSDAIRYLIATLEQYEILMQEDPEIFTHYYAATLQLLGNIYLEKKDIRDELDGSSPFTGFGALTGKREAEKERKEQDKNEAIHYYQKALEVYGELREENEERYTPHIASVIHNLGVLYDEYQDKEKALEHYMQALQIRRKLADADSLAFQADAGVSLLNILTLLWSLAENGDRQSIEKALPLLDEAEKRLKIYPEDAGIEAINSMKSDLAYYRKRFQQAAKDFPKA